MVGRLRHNEDNRLRHEQDHDTDGLDRGNMIRAKMSALMVAAVLALGVQSPALGRDLCTIVADASTRAILHQEGNCETRVTPASTFKIALAVMGFADGILISSEVPKLPFKQGYADWGGAAWKEDATPARWMKHSIVWYSQRLAEAMGAERLGRHARNFGYGNADFSGDPGKNNGLERAWISSSLAISPLEQAAFLAALVERTLPVSAEAMAGAMALVEEAGTVDGWRIFGKTGSAYPRNRDESFDRARGWGWFVGWAEKGGQTLVFARLAQDEERHPVSGGLRARDALVRDWAGLIRAAGL